MRIPTDPLSAAFSALADPTRRAILARLAQGEARVGELLEPFDISGPAISRHLRVLEQAGLIEREVDAQWRVCRVRGPGLQAAHAWLGQYRQLWEASLDRLVDLLEDKPPTPPAAEPQPTRRRTAGPTPPASSPRRRKPS